MDSDAKDGAINEVLLINGLHQHELRATAENVNAQLHAEIAVSNQATEVQRASAERFRFLAESIPQKIFTATPSGSVDYFNSLWMDFTGLSFEQIRDWGWVQFIHPDDVEETVRRWKQSVETGQYFELEHRFRRYDGEYLWHLSRAHAMRDAQGRVLVWMGSNTDIDRPHRDLEETKRHSRSKDEFLAALSHELRTPLTPVLMSATALRDDERLPLDAREQLGMIERNIALEARLIDDLLDLTKLTQGKLDFRPERCDAHQLINFAVEMVQSEANTKKISIERTLNAQYSGFKGDPARFQQVIWNLLRNSVKFTPCGGKISIRTQEEKKAAGETWLRIEIADSGVGIEPARLEQIFVPFEQGGLTPGHRFGGLGLGLAIARGVVELHGGRITAHSAGMNRGATFVVELPGAVKASSQVIDIPSPPSSAASSIADAPLPKARRAPLHLLVVEDHQSTLETLSNLLRRDGHRVVTAATVAEALAAAAADKFELVISDLGLPDGTGNELMEQLRAIHGLRGIALSGYGTEEDRVRSRASGFFTHLIKPVSAAEIRRVLASFSTAQG